MAAFSAYIKLKAFMILLWLFQLKWQLSDSQYFEGTSTLQDKVLRNHVLNSIPSTTSIFDCMVKCSNNENCYSFNFHIVAKVCELNKVTHLSYPDDLYTVPHVVYMLYSLRPFCVDVGKNQVLHFPSKKRRNRIEWEHPFVSLTAFTVTFWVQIDPASKVANHAVFSYALKDVFSNELYIGFPGSDIKFYLHNKICGVVSKPVIDGFWHHIAVTWSNTRGQWYLYVNGTQIAGGKCRKRYTIPKGAVVLGQDQDEYLGGYDRSLSLKGNLTSVNMWDRVLPLSEIASLAAIKCSTVQGNVIQWRQFLQEEKRFGEIQLICHEFCN